MMRELLLLLLLSLCLHQKWHSVEAKSLRSFEREAEHDQEDRALIPPFLDNCTAWVGIVDYYRDNETDDGAFLSCELPNGKIWNIDSIPPGWIQQMMRDGNLTSGETDLELDDDATLDEETGKIKLGKFPPGLAKQNKTKGNNGNNNGNGNCKEKENGNGNGNGNDGSPPGLEKQNRTNCDDDDDDDDDDEEIIDGEDRRSRYMNRILSSATGQRSVLAVRVQDKNGLTNTFSEQELSNSLFGNGVDSVTLTSQYEACSHGQFTLTPTVDQSGTSISIANGVTTVALSQYAANQGDVALRNEITQTLQQEFGVSNVNQLADHVILCLPPGAMSGIAYAFVGGAISVFSDEWCTFVSAQMHEIGHNLGLDHAGEGSDGYGDKSGMMGYSYAEDDSPLQCFNAAKTYQLGWFSSETRVVSQTDLASGALNLQVGSTVHAPGSTPDPKIIKIDHQDLSYADDKGDLFLTFNWQSGMNSETQEGWNQVVIVEQEGDGESYEASWLSSRLSAGQSASFTDYFAPSCSLVVQVNSINLVSGTASLTFSTDGIGCDGSGVCTQDSQCNDGLYCNGQEQCIDGSCVPGSPPCLGVPSFCGGPSICDEFFQSCDDRQGPAGEDGICSSGESIASCPNDCRLQTSCTQNSECTAANQACENGLCVELPECEADGDCDNGLFCDGQEICRNGKCVSGQAPCFDLTAPCGALAMCNEAAMKCELDDSLGEDGQCNLNAGESCSLCPNDCQFGGDYQINKSTCGDGVCTNGEDCLSCPQDCNGETKKSPSQRFCCVGGSTFNTNPLSLVENGVGCNDDRCSTDGFSCYADPPEMVPSCCGDGYCTGTESNVNCPWDCPDDTDPNSPPTCNNDAICDSNETCESCPSDCASKLNGKQSERFCCVGSNDKPISNELGAICTEDESRCSCSSYAEAEGGFWPDWVNDLSEEEQTIGFMIGMALIGLSICLCGLYIARRRRRHNTYTKQEAANLNSKLSYGRPVGQEKPLNDTMGEEASTAIFHDESLDDYPERQTHCKVPRVYKKPSTKRGPTVYVPKEFQRPPPVAPTYKSSSAPPVIATPVSQVDRYHFPHGSS